MSGFVGAVVMTLVAYLLARLPSTMPVYAMFLPGFWLLVPGSLGLIGLTTFLASPETAAGATSSRSSGRSRRSRWESSAAWSSTAGIVGAERRARRLRRGAAAGRLCRRLSWAWIGRPAGPAGCPG